MVNNDQIRRKYFENFGATQLDDVQAETIIEWIGMDFENKIPAKVDESGESGEKLSIMRSIRKNNLPYHEFESNISLNFYNMDLLKELERLILSDQYLLKELGKRSHLFAEILTIEVNHIYRIWYGYSEESTLNFLSGDTIEFLKGNYKKYYLRIAHF
jgi:hypothetical protein